MGAKKITLSTIDDMLKHTFIVRQDKAIGDLNLGPLQPVLTDSGTLLLKSLNKSYEYLVIGYTVLGRELHRYEAGRYLKNRKWCFEVYEPGCYRSGLTLDDLQLCNVKVKIYDLCADITEWDEKSFEYKSPKQEKITHPKAPNRATPPAEIQDSEEWVMI